MTGKKDTKEAKETTVTLKKADDLVGKLEKVLSELAKTPPKPEVARSSEGIQFITYKSDGYEVVALLEMVQKITASYIAVENFTHPNPEELRIVTIDPESIFAIESSEGKVLVPAKSFRMMRTCDGSGICQTNKAIFEVSSGDVNESSFGSHNLDEALAWLKE